MSEFERIVQRLAHGGVITREVATTLREFVIGRSVQPGHVVLAGGAYGGGVKAVHKKFHNTALSKDTIIHRDLLAPYTNGQGSCLSSLQTFKIFKQTT